MAFCLCVASRRLKAALKRTPQHGMGASRAVVVCYCGVVGDPCLVPSMYRAGYVHPASMDGRKQTSASSDTFLSAAP